MADYFTNISLVLELKDEEIDYAVRLAELITEYKDGEIPVPSPEYLEGMELFQDDADNWNCDVSKVPEGLWIHSENGSIDEIIAFVQHLLARFNYTTCVTMEWSNDCSKPRADAFGGGAAVVTATEAIYINTTQWVQRQVDYFTKHGKLPAQEVFPPTPASEG